MRTALSSLTAFPLPCSLSSSLQFKFPFDPSADFHTYGIVWNQWAVTWFVDNIPIRVTPRNGTGPYPKAAMRVHVSNQFMRLHVSKPSMRVHVNKPSMIVHVSKQSMRVHVSKQSMRMCVINQCILRSPSGISCAHTSWVNCIPTTTNNHSVIITLVGDGFGGGTETLHLSCNAGAWKHAPSADGACVCTTSPPGFTT